MSPGALVRRSWIASAAKFAVAFTVVATAMRTATREPTWDRAALAIFEDATLWIALSFVVGFVLVRWRDRVRGIVERPPRWTLDVLLFAIAFGLTLRTSYAAFGAWPQIQDEIAYDLLARRIASGTPVPASHPLPELFRLRFLVDDGRNYVLFQPGWPLLLAFFHKIGRPSMAPAFAVAILVVFASRLAERLYGRITGIVAGVLLLGSAFLQIVGSSYFAHAWTAALVVVSLERLVAALEHEDPKRARRAAIASGLAAAWLFVTRLPAAPGLALAVIATVAAYAVVWKRPRPSILARARVPLLAFAIAASAGPVAQVGWNLATTGRALELPQDKYFAQTEPKPHCHGVGFGPEIGCPREHPLDTRPEGHTFERALVVSNMRWALFRNDAWGTAWPLALVALFFLRRMRARDAIPAAAVAGIFGVYFGFYYHAIQHGVRLWGDLMGPLAVVIAAGACAAFEKSEDEKPGRVHLVACAIGLGLLVLVVHDEHTRDLPDRLVAVSKVRQAEKVRAGLDRGNVHGAVAYIMNCIDPDRGDLVFGWASVLNATPPESGDRMIVRDFGPEHDRQMIALHPDKRHVRVDCNGNVVQWDFATPNPGWLVTELEAKFPPDAREGCYASIKGWAEASNRTVLEVKADRPGAWARFRQHVFEEGTYEVSLGFVRRPDGGRFSLVIDGAPVEPAIDTRGAIGMQKWTASAGRALGKGTHTIEVRSLEGAGTRYFVLDRLELRKL